ncbi:MAG: hypothetical protein R3B93_07440 [Bacteroidia bacterium]
MEKRSQEEIKTIIFKALDNNVNFVKQNVLGIPAHTLMKKSLIRMLLFVKDAPFISTLIQKPQSYHFTLTLGKSEHYFSGST